jgi:predicted nucleic acid-binding protein
MNSALVAKEILRRFKILTEVLSLDDKIIDLALNDNGFSDFEDAIQYYSALENGQDIIITRNLKDFKSSKIPVLTATEYLQTT